MFARRNATGGGAEAARVVGVAYFTSLATGYPKFDEGALAHVSGGAPTWKHLSFAYEAETRGASPTQKFEGVVAVDTEGWVVWYYNVAGINCWDFLPASVGGGVVLLAGEDENTALGTSDRTWTDAASGAHYNANSQLKEIAADGTLRRQYIQGCAGSPLNYNVLSHEMRVDASSADFDVFTTATRIERYPDVNVETRDGAGDDDGKFSTTHADTLAGATIVRWHRDDDTIEPLYNMFDFASPAIFGDAPVTTTWTQLADVACSGGVSMDTLDYHHISSVSIGTHGNLLVSSRNLNTVWSLFANGSGVEWMITSSLWGVDDVDDVDDADADAAAAGAAGAGAAAAASRRRRRLADEGDAGKVAAAKGSHATPAKPGQTFTFERDADKFTASHAVIQLADERLMLVDDGSSRPGCIASTSRTGCFSRAVIYSLDFKSMTARLDWQFEFDGAVADAGALNAKGSNSSARTQRAQWEHAMTHDLFNWDGGSAYRLASGLVLVALTSPWDKHAEGFRDWNANYSMMAWEVAPSGGVLSRVTVPHSLGQLTTQGGYRMIPWASVGGETTEAPGWCEDCETAER